MKDINEVIMDHYQEPICERTGRQIDDGLVPRVEKEIIEEIKPIMEERVEVARLITCCLLLYINELTRSSVSSTQIYSLLLFVLQRLLVDF